jgi:hypothetical protein
MPIHGEVFSDQSRENAAFFSWGQKEAKRCPDIEVYSPIPDGQGLSFHPPLEPQKGLSSVSPCFVQWKRSARSFFSAYALATLIASGFRAFICSTNNTLLSMTLDDDSGTLFGISDVLALFILYGVYGAYHLSRPWPEYLCLKKIRQLPSSNSGPEEATIYCALDTMAPLMVTGVVSLCAGIGFLYGFKVGFDQLFGHDPTLYLYNEAGARCRYLQISSLLSEPLTLLAVILLQRLLATVGHLQCARHCFKDPYADPSKQVQEMKTLFAQAASYDDPIHRLLTEGMSNDDLHTALGLFSVLLTRYQSEAVLSEQEQVLLAQYQLGLSCLKGWAMALSKEFRLLERIALVDSVNNQLSALSQCNNNLLQLPSAQLHSQLAAVFKVYFDEYAEHAWSIVLRSLPCARYIESDRSSNSSLADSVRSF